MNFDALFQQPNALPAAPKIVQELMSSFDDDDTSASDIAHKVAADPVLSAKLLRLANSAFYQIARSVSTVNDAVLMLGLSSVRTVIISSSMIDGFKSAPGMDLKQFWRYSLHTAVVAKWLAKKVKKDTELAFTVGMMHGIGQLVLHVGMPEQAKLLDKTVSPLDIRRLDVEKRDLGCNYAEVSAELALRWKFPDTFIDALRAFPDPLQQKPFDPMGAIVHLAAWFARAHENRLTEDEMCAAAPTEVATMLGIDPCIMVEEMPPLAELGEGMENLLG
jgi:HD-like signal output (HDOD) protein